MTQTTYNSTGSLRNYATYSACTGQYYETNVNYVRRQMIVWKNPTISRTRLLPLYKHCTSLPMQTRMTSLPRIYVARNESAVCGGLSWTERRYSNFFNAYAVPDIGPTDWAKKIRLDVKSKRVNLGTSLVEFPESVKFFRDGAKSIWRAYKDLRRGRLPFHKKLDLTSVASAHLAIDYGIVPIFNDLHDSMSRLNTKIQEPLVRKQTTRSEKEKSWSDGTFDHFVEVSDRVVIYYNDLASSTGFTLGNPAEWLWEVTPFSFVVDHLFDVGNCLSSLDAMSSTTGLFGTRTWKGRYIKTLDKVPSDTISTTYRLEQGSRCEVEQHARFLVSEVPQSFIPAYKPSRSISTLLNDLSLLAVVRRGTKS